MKKYTWIAKVGKSLVPSDFFIHVLQEPLHKAFIYMLLFITFLSVLTGSYVGFKQKSEIDSVVADYEAGIIPPFTISKDGLWVEGNEPVIIDNIRIPIVLDDEGALDINDILTYDKAIFLQKNRAVLTGSGANAMFSYEELGMYIQLMFGGTFDSKRHLVPLKFTSFISIPAGILVVFFTGVISFFYYSLMVLMIANITRTFLGLGIRFKQVYHMVIYAMTFSTFWTHFTYMLPQPTPALLDTFVHFILPSLILLNVFRHIRRKAIDEIEKRRK